MTLWLEMSSTTCLLIVWCFGVGFITFGNTPGSTISNLYFATWASFLLVVFLFAQNFRESIAAWKEQDDEETSPAPPKHAPDDEESGEKGGDTSASDEF